MNNELITIGIPVYNMESSIIAAINSCLNQTYQNIEILVVDDGSTDNTIPLIQRTVSDPRLRIYRRPKNGGVCAAMRDLVDQARGEYICFLDADDTMMPTRVARQYEAIQSMSMRFPGRRVASFCGSAVNDLATGTKYNMDPHNLFNCNARHPFGGGTGHAMYRVADLRALGNFDTRLSRSADSAMCIAFLMNGGIYAMVRDPLITYNFIMDSHKRQVSDIEQKIFQSLRREVVAENPRNIYLRRFADLAGAWSHRRILLFGILPIGVVRHRTDEWGTRRAWVWLFGLIPTIKIKHYGGF